MTATILKFRTNNIDAPDDVPPLLLVTDYPKSDDTLDDCGEPQSKLHAFLKRKHVDAPHIIVRETPFYRYQDHRNEVLHYRAQLQLNADLNADYAGEPQTPKTVSEWSDRWDTFCVWICRSFHRTPTFTPGDNFSRCPSCSRKYALPWANLNEVASDVYVCDDTFVGTTEPTLQAVCRNG